MIERLLTGRRVCPLLWATGRVESAWWLTRDLGPRWTASLRRWAASPSNQLARNCGLVLPARQQGVGQLNTPPWLGEGPIAASCCRPAMLQPISASRVAVTRCWPSGSTPWPTGGVCPTWAPQGRAPRLGQSRGRLAPLTCDATWRGLSSPAGMRAAAHPSGFTLSLVESPLGRNAGPALHPRRSVAEQRTSILWPPGSFRRPSGETSRLVQHTHRPRRHFSLISRLKLRHPGKQAHAAQPLTFP